jgi:hypothetical protein
MNGTFLEAPAGAGEARGESIMSLKISTKSR